MNDQVNYPKGDLRRMLQVLGAIDAIPGATLVRVATRTGLDKKTVSSLIRQAAEQAHVRIEKDGPVYVIADWGPVIKRAGAKKALTGALNAPMMVVSTRAGGGQMSDRAAWEGEVIDAVAGILGITYSDATGVVGAQPFRIAQSWSAGLDPGAAAKAVIADSEK